MPKNVSLFDLSFNTQVFEEGRDGYIIMGELSLGNKKIAKAFDSGHGAAMEFDLYISRNEWNDIQKRVGDAYVKMGVYDKPPLEPVGLLIEDLINLESAQKYYSLNVKRKGIKQPVVTVFIKQEDYYKSISSICAAKALSTDEISDKAVKVVGAFPISQMHIMDDLLHNKKVENLR